MKNPAKKNVYKYDKPTSLRLGELKSIYYEEAIKIDRSIHWLMIKGLKEYAKTFKQ